MVEIDQDEKLSTPTTDAEQILIRKLYACEPEKNVVKSKLNKEGCLKIKSERNKEVFD